MVAGAADTKELYGPIRYKRKKNWEACGYKKRSVPGSYLKDRLLSSGWAAHRQSFFEGLTGLRINLRDIQFSIGELELPSGKSLQLRALHDTCTTMIQGVSRGKAKQRTNTRNWTTLVNTTAIVHRQNSASFVQILVLRNIGRVYKDGSIRSRAEREEKERSNTKHIDGCNVLYRRYQKANASHRPRGKKDIGRCGSSSGGGERGKQVMCKRRVSETQFIL